MPSVHLLSNSVLPNPKQVVYRISGCDDRVVLMDELNDREKVLHRPIFYRQPDRLYQYLLKHPNRHINRKEIEGAYAQGFSMTFPEIVSCLNFRGELRRLFFLVSKYDICFHNPVTWERMQGMHIKTEDIEPFFSTANIAPYNMGNIAS